MLAATYTASTDFLCQAVERHAARARFWLKRSYERASCDDAYSDLLLATEQYGVARAYCGLIEDVPTRLGYAADIDQLMAELLTRSHQLRVACRAPIAP